VSSTNIATSAIAANPTNTFTITAHSFVTGDNVIFETTGTAPTGLVAGYYYFIRKIDNNTIKLFNTAADASANTNPVTFSNVGTGLVSFHKNTPNAPIIRKITAIGSDLQITVDRPYATTYSGRSYSYATFIYVRPQGYSLHRPFDGGVEMSVGTNTSFGQIIRQTRKYFRYQSGKGLQTSFGINFKPTIDIENLVRESSTTFKCTTRRPHSLISGLTVKISEAETSTGALSTVFNGNFQVTVQDAFMQAKDSDGANVLDLRWYATKPSEETVVALTGNRRGYIAPIAGATLELHVSDKNTVPAGIYPFDLFVKDSAGDWDCLASGTVVVEASVSVPPT
jgi:hypothetical protein